MRVRWSILLGAALAAAPLPLVAQQFDPPRAGSASRGTRLGFYGFGVRGGFDFKDAGQLVLGSTLDFGNLFTSAVRLRPSFEIGVFNGPNTYVGSFEALWRLTENEEVATPYVGLGLSLAGRDQCGTDPECPDLWLNLAVGLELRYRSTFNWLIEYHAMDLFKRHRVYIGLTTRRGN